MLTLSLLRHAKSSWDDPELEDHERPLSLRGAADAPRMGAFMAEKALNPELVLCSSSVRTRATLMLVLTKLDEAPPDILYEDGLYHAAPAKLLARARKVDNAIGHVLLVGHNPGLHALVLELTGAGKEKHMSAIAAGFPSGALAVLDFDLGGWTELAPGLGALRLYKTPKSLA